MLSKRFLTSLRRFVSLVGFRGDFGVLSAPPCAFQAMCRHYGADSLRWNLLRCPSYDECLSRKM